MTTKPLVKTTKAMPKVPKSMTKSLARSGEFNILWAIVAVVGIALGLFLIFYVFHGAMPSLGASNTLTVTAEELGGVLVVNMKAMGVSATKITGVQLLPSGSCIWTAYLNGQQQSTFTPPITLNPGDTLSLVCTNPPSGVTEVEVITTSGAYTAPIS
ncbi:hypothetical protein B7L70_03475 [Vulcanisaeta sp. EB80]|uniref:hypothetical protein n=1 Tax=Vulcanisaeta sp. EB80 TaxID=1650660 RepID=UPI0009BF4F2A|nr:hypothetical protein [Vulcanisaeta sp. EB80]PLC68437.1 hypothetical protein B7L70_03475 [Vulcanisaeta sp. EB80]